MYAKSILFARIIRFIERNENLENTCMGYRRGEVNASKCAINRTQLISIMPLWSGLIWTILQSISYWNSFICCYLYAESDKTWYCVDYMVVYLTSNGCRKKSKVWQMSCTTNSYPRNWLFDNCYYIIGSDFRTQNIHLGFILILYICFGITVFSTWGIECMVIP